MHAFRSDSRDHSLCHAWLGRVLNGDSRYSMSTQVLSSVVRVTTHPKVFAQPSEPSEVLGFCDVLLSQPHCVVVQPRSHHWSIFRHLCEQADARGNLVPDAWLAALAIESGCEWLTLDRDYARFPELKWSVPSGS